MIGSPQMKTILSARLARRLKKKQLGVEIHCDPGIYLQPTGTSSRGPNKK